MALVQGMYHVHRKYKLSPMYNKTCTFLHLKTNYTAIPMKGDISDKSVITQPNLNDISLISLTFLPHSFPLGKDVVNMLQLRELQGGKV